MLATCVLLAAACDLHPTEPRAPRTHSLDVEWMESATWDCADDMMPSDNELDCDPGYVWDMDNPQSPSHWDEPAFSTVPMTGTPLDTLEFDVTAQVAAFLGGQAANPGWALKKEDETLGGRPELSSRESGSPPELVRFGQEVMRSVPPLVDQESVTDDPTFVVDNPNVADFTYYRRLMAVRFLDSASDSVKLGFFNSFAATVVGGSTFVGEYYVQVPDPGASYAAYESLLRSATAHPAVQYAAPIAARSASLVLSGGYLS